MSRRHRQSGQSPSGRRWEAGRPPLPESHWLRRLGGIALPLMTIGLAPSLFVSLLAGSSRQALGCLLGIGLAALAGSRMARGRRRDGKRAAMLMGTATGLAALMAGGAPPLIAVMLGLGAGFGTAMLQAGLREAPEPLPEPGPRPMPIPEPAMPRPAPAESAATPEPPLAPPPLAEDPAIAAARGRLLRIRHTAVATADPNLSRAVDALETVLDDLTRNPAWLPEARRFLVVQLDGLTRIAERLDAGATPPATLHKLLDDMAGAATSLRQRLRAQETEALEIQVKVMADRLRQEGYA